MNIIRDEVGKGGEVRRERTKRARSRGISALKRAALFCFSGRRFGSYQAADPEGADRLSDDLRLYRHGAVRALALVAFRRGQRH